MANHAINEEGITSIPLYDIWSSKVSTNLWLIWTWRQCHHNKCCDWLPVYVAGETEAGFVIYIPIGCWVWGVGVGCCVGCGVVVCMCVIFWYTLLGTRMEIPNPFQHEYLTLNNFGILDTTYLHGIDHDLPGQPTSSQFEETKYCWPTSCLVYIRISGWEYNEMLLYPVAISYFESYCLSFLLKQYAKLPPEGEKEANYILLVIVFSA